MGYPLSLLSFLIDALKQSNSTKKILNVCNEHKLSRTVQLVSHSASVTQITEVKNATAPMQAAVHYPGVGGSIPTTLYHRVYRGGGAPERKVFDKSYVDGLTQGDPETEAHFTQYFGTLLLIKLRGRLRSPQLVEDARQETFLRVLNVLRNKGGIQHPERLGAFVNAVCENVLSETYRASGKFQQTPESTPTG